MGKGAVVAISVAHDTKGKRDASRAFIPEAKAFADYWADDGFHTHVALIDNRKPRAARRAETLAAVRAFGPIAHLGLFCHGWRNGVQVGFRVQELPALTEALAQMADTSALRVSLYCCSTAHGGTGGDGGFADVLRDQLCERGLINCRIDGHTTRGHTTKNPYVRRFEGEGSHFGGQGGRFIVRPRGPLWREWRACLRDRSDPLRYAMTSLQTSEIHEWLWPVS